MDNFRTILFATPQQVYLPNTGGEKYLAEIYASYKDRNKEIYLCDINWMPYFLKKMPLIFIIFISNFYFIFMSLKKRRQFIGAILIEDYHYHCRLFIFNVVAKHILKCKIVQTFLVDLFYHPLLRFSFLKIFDSIAAKIFLKQADMIAVNSEYNRSKIVKIMNITQDKIRVIHCGFEPLNGERAMGGAVHPEKMNTCFNLLFVGRCNEIKGVLYLVRAVVKLRQKGYSLRLDIVGDPNEGSPYAKQMTEEIFSQGMEKYIVMHGQIKDRNKLTAFFERADIFVVPSIFEGYAQVLLEALTFGIPIVATNVGGNPEIVKDGASGFLVPPGDSEALTAAIQRLVDSPETMKHFSREGLKYMESRCDYFTWKALKQRFWNVLLEL